MMLFIGSKRFCLRNKIPSVLAIIVRPAMHFRNLPDPVSMSRSDRRCPFQRIRSPWIFYGNLSSFENGIKKVEYEHELNSKYHKGHIRNELIQPGKFIKGRPSAVIHIPARHAGQSFIMHRPENQVGPDKGNPEMYIRHRIIHVSPEHFWEPVIYATEHSEEGGHTHHQVKMRNHEIGIVQVNIERCVT